MTDAAFIEIMDELVLDADNDQDLKEGLKWIDGEAAKRGIDFYEMALITIREHMAEKKAKEWMKNQYNQSES